MVSAGTARITDRQLTEHLLCTECEERFSKAERVVACLLLKTGSSTPWMEALRPIADENVARHHYYDSSAVDLSAAITFGVSIVWRASVSTVAPRTALGPYEEPFRRFLLGEAAFPVEGFLLIQLLSEARTAVRTDRTISVPTPARLGPTHTHWFAFLGAVFTLGAGRMHHEGVQYICAARTGRVQVSPSELLLPMLQHTVQKSKAMGRLTTLHQE